jgi:TonB-dependent starch-binding outer membrane protein SusC
MRASITVNSFGLTAIRLKTYIFNQKLYLPVGRCYKSMQNAAICIRATHVRYRYTQTKTLFAGKPDLLKCSRTNMENLLLAMKLTTILLLGALVNVSAKGVSQNITWSGTKVSLRTVFTEIEKQTPLTFIYTESIFDRSKPVTISANNIPVANFLKELFAEQPFNYVIRNNNVTVSLKSVNEKSDKKNISPVLNAPPVSGIVRGPDGQPLSNANIIIKGTKRGTTTNADGSFSIEANRGEVVIISSIGFSEKQITVGENNIGAISLSASESKLDEVQIIAYGQTSQRFNAGNVTSVKATDIEKQPVNNPLLTLQGRVPGLFITQATGYAGTGVKVRIQGQNSINNGNDPLYVIDGVPFTSQLLPTINLTNGNSGQDTYQNGKQISGNPLNFINPNDIESIDILKDADATAIYGSRAANGAILITTKKGKSGKLKVDINVQTGWGKVGTKYKVLNNKQYLEVRNEGLSNDGLTPDPDRDRDLFNNYGWSNDRNVNWQKVLIGKTSIFNNYQASLSGGNESIQYLVGGTYRRETTVVPGDYVDHKESVHFNINSTSANKKFRMLFTGNYLQDDNRLPNFDLTSYAFTLPPTAPELHNSDGAINWAPNSSGTTTWGIFGNPIAPLENKSRNKTNNIIGNATFSYAILPGLDLKSSFGYNKLQSEDVLTFPFSGIAPEERQFNTRSSIFGNSSNSSWIIEPQIAYRKGFGVLKLDALAGGTIQENIAKAVRLNAYGYGNDNVLGELSNATNIGLDFSSINEYKYNAIFSRINLNLKDEYILNLTARRDGSSRFGALNKYHTFGSVAGAWIFSQTDYIKNVFPFLSFGKVKASYGTTGSDQISDYKYLTLYLPTIRLPYQDVVGMLPESFSNPYLQWEETKKLQVGIDLGFINDRILFSANYFRNLSSNQLLQYNLPVITGFSSVTSNFPATIQNKGWELSISTNNLRSKYFSWSTNANITISRNELTEFPDLANSSYFKTLVVGEPLSNNKVYKFAGVDPLTGVYQFIDINNKLTSEPVELVDNYVNVSTDPKFYGGFQNSFSYKSISLDVLFQFVKQIGLDSKFGLIPGYAEATNGNQPIGILDRWRQEGDIALIQRYNSDLTLLTPLGRALVSDKAYSDASYIRLKNLSISWSVPKRMIDRLRIQNIQVFGQGQNLLTITRYKGLDPETRSNTTLPPLRMIVIGVKATL